MLCLEMLIVNFGIKVYRLMQCPWLCNWLIMINANVLPFSKILTMMMRFPRFQCIYKKYGWVDQWLQCGHSNQRVYMALLRIQCFRICCIVKWSVFKQNSKTQKSPKLRLQENALMHRSRENIWSNGWWTGCNTILLDELISSDFRFVYRFCTCCNVPYSGSHAKSSSFLSPDIYRKVLAKKKSFWDHHPKTSGDRNMKDLPQNSEYGTPYCVQNRYTNLWSLLVTSSSSMVMHHFATDHSSGYTKFYCRKFIHSINECVNIATDRHAACS